MAKVRIDKWLWAIRVYKTRSQASEACKAGRVRIDDRVAKSSSEVQEGNRVEVRRKSARLILVCLKAIDKRVGAPLALQCYEDHSPPAEPEEGRPFFYAPSEKRDRGAGRPTKKERRELDEFKQGPEE